MELWYEFCEEEEALGVVEIILILVVIIGLVILFRDKLTAIINNIFTKITNQSNTV